MKSEKVGIGTYEGLGIRKIQAKDRVTGRMSVNLDAKEVKINVEEMDEFNSGTSKQDVGLQVLETGL